MLVIKYDLALSAFLGGLICVLPNYYLARQMFLKFRSANPQQVLWAILIAEGFKILLALILFATVFIFYKDLHAFAMLITYFITQSCMWVVPLFTVKQDKNIHRQTI